MRIALWHNLPSGGGKRAFYDHVRGLVAKGHTVESWCPPTADQNYLPVNTLIKEHVVPLNWQPPSPTNRLSAFRAFARGPIGLLKALDEHCRRCADEINRGGFDVFFANTCQVMHVAHIGRYVKTPKVLYVHQPNRALYEAIPSLPWIGTRSAETSTWTVGGLKARALDSAHLKVIRTTAREELRNVQAYHDILVNSFFSREAILRTYGLRAKVCYLGIDTSLFRPLARTRERFIVSLGAFYPTKGVELAINSISRLKSPRPPLVWIANDSNSMFVEEMKAFAASVGVQLEIRSRVSDEELVDTLNRAALMLYTPHLEPFGLAALEANACGTPVVGIAEAGLRETVINELNGLLTDPEPESIATAIEKLLNDPALAEKYGKQGADYVNREWTVEGSIDRLEGHLIRTANAAVHTAGTETPRPLTIRRRDQVRAS